MKPLQINDLMHANSTPGHVANVNVATNASPPKQERQSRRQSSSVTRTESIISSLTSLNTSTVKPDHHKPKTPVKTPHTPRSRTPSIITSFKQRAFSSDRKKRIEKIDISCPFRCSTNDLHLNGTDMDSRNQSTSLSQVILKCCFLCNPFHYEPTLAPQATFDWHE